MATTDLKQVDYNTLLAGDGINSTAIAELDLPLPGKAVVQDDFAEQGDNFVADAHGNLPNLVLVNGAISGADTINTDLDAQLRAIVALNGDHLTVQGTLAHNVFITTDAAAGDAVFLQDAGNDHVTLQGSGQEVVGGAGRDTLIDQGAGGNSLLTGSGAGTVAIDASSGGGDGLQAQGSHQLLVGEANDHLINGGANTNDTMLGGSFLADFGGSNNMLASAVAGATFNLGDQGGDTVLAGGANATINEMAAGPTGNTLIALGTGSTINVNGVANDTLIGAADHSTVVNSGDVSTDIVSQTLNSQTGVTTMTLGDGQVLKLANITSVNFSDGVSVAVDPPANVNSHVADVVAAAQTHVDNASAHAAAVEAHWASV